MKNIYVILLLEGNNLSFRISVCNGYSLERWCAPNSRHCGAVLCCLRCRGLKCVVSLIPVHKSEVRTSVTCNAGFIAVNFPPLIKEQRREDGVSRTRTVSALNYSMY